MRMPDPSLFPERRGLGALRQHYSDVLDVLAACFGEQLWIVGGWARAELLGSNYAGDIDCVIVADVEQIRQFAIAAGFNVGSTPFGNPHVVLADGNHLDLIPAAGPTGEDAVLQVIGTFNFSINSVAVNYATGAVVRTPHNLKDAAAGAFRVNDQFQFHTELWFRRLARDFEVFEKCYGLSPVPTAPTLRVQKLATTYRMRDRGEDVAQSLGARWDEISACVPVPAQAWIVGGTVRCALLGQIKYWDDVDVITTASGEDIVRHLTKTGMPFAPNHAGAPNVHMPKGLIVDIWTLDGCTLETELASYPHNLDAIAWSVRDRRLCDPLGVAEAIAQRRLDINPAFIANASAREFHYAALKSIYLVIRHSLTFSDSAAELMRIPIVPEPLLIKQVIGFVRKLCLCMPPQTIARAFAELESTLRTCDAMGLMGAFIERVRP